MFSFNSPDGATAWLRCSNVARPVGNSAVRLLFESTLVNFLAKRHLGLVAVVHQVALLECRHRRFRPDADQFFDRLPNSADLRRLVQRVAIVASAPFVWIFNNSACDALQLVAQYTCRSTMSPTCCFLFFALFRSLTTTLHSSVR